MSYCCMCNGKITENKIYMGSCPNDDCKFFRHDKIQKCYEKGILSRKLITESWESYNRQLSKENIKEDQK